MLQSGNPLTLDEINQLSIKYADIIGNEAIVKNITIPLKYDDALQQYKVMITVEALFDLVHLAQTKGMHIEIKHI